MLFWLRLFAFTLLIGSAQLAKAVDSDHPAFMAAAETNPVKVEILQEEETIKPGKPFWVAVKMTIEENWHSYWKNPGDAGMPLTIEWTLPEGFFASPAEWPYPRRFDLNSLIGFGYEGETLFLVRITPPEKISLETPASIEAKVRWLVCNDTMCLPGESEAKVVVPLADAVPKLKEDYTSHFAKAREALPKKQWSVQAKREGDLIELRLQPPDNFGKTVSGAYFCPEVRKQIDHSTQAVLTRLAAPAKGYTVILKDSPTAAIKTAALKGILVLSTSDGQTEALDIDIPISSQGTAQNPIGMADASSSKSSVKPIPVVVPLESQQEEFEGGLAVALVFAFLGGLILNLMPCVLPVLSFKIMSFVKMAGQSRRATLKHAGIFSLGIILSFWVLAGALLILQSYGHAVGWGFQLQEPIFVGLLAGVMVIFGLSMFGLFEMGTSITSMAGQAQANNRKNGLMGSFLGGVLATAVATPCTGPFLGSAIGFAVTLPAPQALLIFSVLGFGMAFPYLLLSAFPSLHQARIFGVKLIPQPGPWMETFKQLMGFFMFATVLWLIWVFGAQTSMLGIFLLLSGFFILSIGCWILGRWGNPARQKAVRAVGTITAAVFLLTGTWTIVKAASSEMTLQESKVQYTAVKAINQSETVWENFSPQRVEELQSRNIPVIIDFTAKWCLICQANHLVLTNAAVSEALDRMGVVRMKADWTRNDPVITNELKKFGRNGVPLYVLYGKDPSQAPQILPQVLTTENVLEALSKIKEPFIAEK